MKRRRRKKRKIQAILNKNLMNGISKNGMSNEPCHFEILSENMGKIFKLVRDLNRDIANFVNCDI